MGTSKRWPAENMGVFAHDQKEGAREKTDAKKESSKIGPAAARGRHVPAPDGPALDAGGPLPDDILRDGVGSRGRGSGGLEVGGGRLMSGTEV